jgi:hypothetical protein
MERKPAERPRPEPSTGARSAGNKQRGEDARDERYGPVAVERSVKDDGRALIVYRHAGRAQP